MQARFFTVRKQRNSTKRGTGGTSYAVILKDGCSVQRPVLALKWDGSGAPTAYNGCFIEAWDRFYWVDNWTYQDRQWVATCSVDVLATYKESIGSYESLILRAADDYDPNVCDALALPIMPPENRQIIVKTYEWATTIGTGFFVISVTGNRSAPSTTGITYYQVTAAELQNLVSEIFGKSTSEWANGNFGQTVMAALQEFGRIMNVAMDNPTSFINSVTWFPFAFPSTGRTNIWLGNFLPNQTGELVSGACYTISDSVSFTYTGEPWENMPPYANYQFGFLPWGVFELDAASLMAAGGELSYFATVDPISGIGTLQIKTGYGSTARNLATRTAQIGIPVQFGGNSIDTSKLMQEAASIGAYMASGGTTGLAGMLNSAAGVVQPDLVCTGSSAGLAGIWAQPWIQIQKFPHTPVDVVHDGRPLCATEAVLLHEGYLKLQDGDVPILGTPAEAAEIRSYLTGGFYYE